MIRFHYMSTFMSTSTYVVVITPLPDLASCRAKWLSLQERANHSFFQSWHWIGNWLESLPDTSHLRLLVVSARSGDPIALAILGVRRTLRHGVLPVRSLHLHSVGDKTFDCISAEYGNLLVARTHESTAWTAVLNYLHEHQPCWDELVLEGVSPTLVDSWTAKQLPHHVLRRVRTHFIPLDQVRASADHSCMALISAGTRAHIRRSQRSLEAKHGPVKLDIATTVDQAQRYMDAMKQLHERRWATRAGGGAFSRPYFESFHRSLVESGFGAGIIQLARISSGSQDVGYVYNFVYQGRVYFYQSGINYDAGTKRDSPGLLMQSLLINHNAKVGHTLYDLMAGDREYKRSLATESAELLWVALQQQRWKLALEEAARHVYHKLRTATRSAS